MHSVSDDDVWKRLLDEKSRFQLVAKGVFRVSDWELGRCYTSAGSDPLTDV